MDEYMGGWTDKWMDNAENEHPAEVSPRSTIGISPENGSGFLGSS